MTIFIHSGMRRDDPLADFDA